MRKIDIDLAGYDFPAEDLNKEREVLHFYCIPVKLGFPSAEKIAQHLESEGLRVCRAVVSDRAILLVKTLCKAKALPE